MSDHGRISPAEHERHVTGHFGEDQFDLNALVEERVIDGLQVSEHGSKLSLELPDELTVLDFGDELLMSTGLVHTLKDPDPTQTFRLRRSGGEMIITSVDTSISEALRFACRIFWTRFTRRFHV